MSLSSVGVTGVVAYRTIEASGVRYGRNTRGEKNTELLYVLLNYH